jgi:hypothetical protein
MIMLAISSIVLSSNVASIVHYCLSKKAKPKPPLKIKPKVAAKPVIEKSIVAQPIVANDRHANLVVVE